MRKKKEVKPKSVDGVVSLTCKELADRLDLKIVSEGRGNLKVCSNNINRPGLQFAGYFEHFPVERIQVVGNAETTFLRQLPEDKKSQVLEKFFASKIPCVVVTHGLEIDSTIIKYAILSGCPIFSSSLATTILISEMSNYFSQLLAPTMVMHGVMMDISGVGVLITGHAGIGKSETALDLISRGHRLIADDSVVITNIRDHLVSSCPEKIQYFMEVRGVGIINVKSMFGPGAIRPEKAVELVAELVPWDKLSDFDRLGMEQKTTNILEIEVPKIEIPVTPGRNIPIILETAARKYRLEQFGYSAVDELLKGKFQDEK